MFLAFFSLTIILTTSCTEDGDITNPTITLSSPVDGDVFSVDDKIELVGRATDDTALEKLNISSILGLNEDFTSFDDPTDFPFVIDLTLDQATSPGDYSISLLVTDTSGNTGEYVVEVQIQ